MKIGICDSSMHEVEAVKDFIESRMDLDNVEFELYLPEEASIDVEESTFSCDIFITEIVFDNLQYNGICLARAINRSVPNCKIIFYADHIPDGWDIYDVEHCNCVMKRNQDIKLVHAVDMAIKRLNMSRSNFIRVCYGKTINIFSASEIICIHRDDRLTRYCTTRGDYVQYITLTNALKNLPKVFVRVNSNCIINRQHVKHYSRSTVTLDNGEVVKIGRPYKEEVFS